MEEAFLWYILMFSAYMIFTLNTTYTFIALRNRFSWLLDARLADRFWTLLNWLVYTSMALTGVVLVVWLIMLILVPFEAVAFGISLAVSTVLGVGFYASAKQLKTRLFVRLNLPEEQKKFNQTLIAPKLRGLVLTYVFMSAAITYGLLHFWFTNQILP